MFIYLFVCLSKTCPVKNLRNCEHVNWNVTGYECQQAVWLFRNKIATGSTGQDGWCTVLVLTAFVASASKISCQQPAGTRPAILLALP
jgi:hypothetical protein